MCSGEGRAGQTSRESLGHSWPSAVAKLDHNYGLREAWVVGAVVNCVLQSQASKSATPV